VDKGPLSPRRSRCAFRSLRARSKRRCITIIQFGLSISRLDTSWRTCLASLASRSSALSCPSDRIAMILVGKHALQVLRAKRIWAWLQWYLSENMALKDFGPRTSCAHHFLLLQWHCFLWQRSARDIYPAKEIIFVCYHSKNFMPKHGNFQFLSFGTKSCEYRRLLVIYIYYSLFYLYLKLRQCKQIQT